MSPYRKETDAMHSGVLFTLTVLLGQLCVGSGLKCYQCTFSTFKSDVLNINPNCDEGSNFNGKNLTDYLQTTQCDGMCSMMRADVNGIRTIVRGCMSNCTDTNINGNGIFCCNTDFCNDTWRVKASLVGAVASVLVAYLLQA